MEYPNLKSAKTSGLLGVMGEFTQYKCGCTVDRKGELMSICPEHSQHERKGDWIHTYLGVQFWPLDPRPDEVRLLDIAHSLSLLCRFTGHCKQFYSVAQHSVMVSNQVPESDARWGLLHDAAEAYLGDMSRPIKRFSAFGTEYKVVESWLMRVIASKFELPAQQPASIALADDILLMTEKRDLLCESPASWRETSEPLDIRIVPWTPVMAEHMFLQRAKELGL